jgi:hypothetical protein
MANIHVFHKIIISSVLLLLLAIGISTHIQVPSSSIKISKREEVKGITTANQSVLWSGLVNINPGSTKVTLPPESWPSLSNYLKLDQNLEIKDNDSNQTVLAKVKEISSACLGKNVCKSSYAVEFSPEILPLLGAKSNALHLQFSLPKS